LLYKAKNYPESWIEKRIELNYNNSYLPVFCRPSYAYV